MTSIAASAYEEKMKNISSDGEGGIDLAVTWVKNNSNITEVVGNLIYNTVVFDIETQFPGYLSI